MLAYQIVAGFSEIKSELRTKFGPNKKLDDLHLWFSFEEGILYAHDYSEHERCIALAIYENVQKTWQITFRGGAYGQRLINLATNSYELTTIARDFYTLYRSYGYFIPR